MDWPAVTATVASRYEGLASSTGETLRSAPALPPDAIVAPCAITILRDFRDLDVMAGWLTGTALFDVLILLEPKGDVPRRYAAMLSWVTPAMVATLTHTQLGLLANVSSAVPDAVEVSPAGESDTYAGLPYDLVRVTVAVSFRDQVAVSS